MSLGPGKIIGTPVITTLRKNIHNILDNYYGITVTHYRRVSTVENTYGDFTSDVFTTIESALVHLESQDYDVLMNNQIHFEDLLPIRIFLDPNSTWRENDEILVELDMDDATTYSQRFVITKIMSANKAGLSIYRTGQIATVRRCDDD